MKWMMTWRSLEVEWQVKSTSWDWNVKEIHQGWKLLMAGVSCIIFKLSEQANNSISQITICKYWQWHKKLIQKKEPKLRDKWQAWLSGVHWFPPIEYPPQWVFPFSIGVWSSHSGTLIFLPFYFVCSKFVLNIFKNKFYQIYLQNLNM